ncbi:hypothetical protein V1502_10700 [Bacillus sp. SCS-153A]|uniref:hypothetical protein n=1 Tax=Rossellomorea sedimentorum TaxID=3115294 RepID=UPI003905E222
MNYFNWFLIFSIVWVLWTLPHLIYYQYKHSILIKRFMKWYLLSYILSYIAAFSMSASIYLLLLNGLSQQRLNMLSPAVPSLLMVFSVVLTFMISYYCFLLFSKEVEGHSRMRLFFQYILLVALFTIVYGAIFLALF